MLRYYKGDPNHQILVQRQGQIRRSGLGLSFWYMSHNTNILAVPATSLDAGFSLSEYTQDHQELHIHGSVSFRITEPLAAAGSLPFEVDADTGRPTVQGRQLLESRVIAAVQSHCRPIVQEMAFEHALRAGAELVGSLEGRLTEDSELKALGLTVEGIHLLELSPAPELRKALEAEYRESLNKRADDAIYGRRFSAQQQESKLAKDKLDAEISREEERKGLVERQTTNQLRQAEAEAKAERMKLEPYAELSGQSLVGLALRQFAEHPQTIGQLSITPDLLSQLSGWMTRQDGAKSDAA
jgi:regulator of protease activity HflC (stomatin/prohibitin superfamily)